MISELMNFPQIIYLGLDQDYKLRALSPAGEQYLDNSLSRLSGRSIFDILPKTHPISENVRREDRFSLYDQRFFLLNTSSELFDIHQYRSKDSIHILLYPKPGFTEHNMTHIARGALRQASGMAAMLGHEIRNPLSAIKGAAQLLSQDASKEDRDLLAVIQEEGSRIGRIVNEFEDMAGDSPPTIEAVNIHQILNQVLRAAQAGYARDITIQEIYDPSLPEIAADPDRLKRSLANILKNAAEAINQRFEHPDAQGKIKVQTRYRGGYKRNHSSLPVEISISDNGGGMDESIQSDAFQPFITTKVNGTGLGLSVLARTIEEIGGAVEVDNLGQGCTFRMLLPIWGDEWKER